jgi:RNA polymerase sigma-B factor
MLAVRAARGDERAREELLVQMAPLVTSVARRFDRTVPRADLEQAGALGVLAAIRGYDGERGTAFEAYASRYVLGEMLSVVRESTSIVRVPRSVREAARDVEAAVHAFQRDHGRSPTVAEIAARTGLDDEKVIDALQARRMMQPVAAEEAAIDELPAVDEGDIELAERRLDLGQRLERLDPRSRRILALRFGAGLSQTEIAQRVGISQMHVSRLLRAALGQLEAELQ